MPGDTFVSRRASHALYPPTAAVAGYMLGILAHGHTKRHAFSDFKDNIIN